MYNFQKQRQSIIQSAKEYGVTIVLVDNGSLHGILQFSGEFKGSDGVKRYLERKMETYNNHSKQGM